MKTNWRRVLKWAVSILAGIVLFYFLVPTVRQDGGVLLLSVIAVVLSVPYILRVKWKRYVALAMAGLAGASYLIGPSFWWDGAVSRVMKVSVIDESNQQPVPKAEVAFLWHDKPWRLEDKVELSDGKPTYSGLTGDDGKVSILGFFGAGGQNRMFIKTGSFGFGGCGLLVTAAGYQDTTVNLSDQLGERRSIHNRRLLNVVVKLKKESPMAVSQPTESQ